MKTIGFPRFIDENVYTMDEVDHIVEGLQQQINDIVSGDATVSLSASPSAIFVNEQSTINLTASANESATAIVIKKGSTTIDTGSGTSKSASDTVTPDSVGTIQYGAEFTIAGNTRTASRSVSVVNKIYYGIGTETISDYQDFVEDSGIQYQSARTSPNGSYTYTPTASNKYIYIIEPYSMSAINLDNVKLGNLGYNLQLVTDNATIDNTRYRVYRSVSDNQAVQFTITVNN